MLSNEAEEEGGKDDGKHKNGIDILNIFLLSDNLLIFKEKLLLKDPFRNVFCVGYVFWLLLSL